MSRRISIGRTVADIFRYLLYTNNKLCKLIFLYCLNNKPIKINTFFKLIIFNIHSYLWLNEINI